MTRDAKLRQLIYQHIKSIFVEGIDPKDDTVIEVKDALIAGLFEKLIKTEKALKRVVIIFAICGFFQLISVIAQIFRH